MLVDCRLDDVMLTQAFTGLDTNMLRPSVIAAGLDPQALKGGITPERARELFGSHANETRGPRNENGPKRWVDIWSAGHSVSGIDRVRPVAELVILLAADYAQAQRSTADLLAAETARLPKCCHSSIRTMTTASFAIASPTC